MSTDELVTVYEAPNPVAARIVAADLQDNGIICTVSGENQGAYVGVPIVPVVVMVNARDAERARELLVKHEPKPTEETEEAETA